jgi:saccharopine dehydrogenase (NADP+, L-glutamate forming)
VGKWNFGTCPQALLANTLTDIESQETFTSTLELLGDPDRYSAMALSVGVTCGIATQLLIDRHPAVCKPGVHAPYTKDMCDIIRDRVKKEGLKVFEQKL